MSIADKLTYLQTTKQLLKTEINKINNVLDDNSTFRSYPQELFNGYLDILNNGTDTLWNNLEKVSASGEEATLENVETAPIKMVLNGNTSQDGEPTPDTPVEVKVVKGENVVSVSGKNLFDKDVERKNAFSTGNVGQVVGYGNSSASYSYVNCAELKAGKTYTLSWTTEGTKGATTNRNSKIVDDNNIVLEEFATWINNVSKITFAPSNDGYLVLTTDISSTNIQLELGSTATDFVPYSKTDYSINLGTIELCKINTYKDYFHKDSGKWYVHKEIGKKVFDGSESWTLSSLGAGRFYLEISPIFKMISETAIGIKPYSSHFVGKDNSLGFENRKVVLMTSSYGGTTHYFARFENDNTPTLSEWKTWLSNNNVTLYYVLSTPTEEEITNTTLISQLEAIANAKSVKDKTYITQTNDELPFILDVEAIKEYEVV